MWEPIRDNELTLLSSSNTRPQSSQLAEPLWTDPGLKSEISVRELISIKSAVEHSPKILVREEKATTTTTTILKQVWQNEKEKKVQVALYSDTTITD